MDLFGKKKKPVNQIISTFALSHDSNLTVSLGYHNNEEVVCVERRERQYTNALIKVPVDEYHYKSKSLPDILKHTPLRKLSGEVKAPSLQDLEMFSSFKFSPDWDFTVTLEGKGENEFICVQGSPKSTGELISQRESEKCEQDGNNQKYTTSYKRLRSVDPRKFLFWFRNRHPFLIEHAIGFIISVWIMYLLGFINFNF